MFGLGFGALGSAAAKADSSEYVRHEEKWRAEQEADLKQEEGWLTLAGLYWLKDGKNTMGTGADCALPLPAGSAPEKVGSLILHGGNVTFEAADGVGATCKGEAVVNLAMRSDADGSPDRVTIGRLTFIVIHRGHRIGVRLWDKESRTRSDFPGMHWFPVDEKLKVTAKFVPYEPPKPVTIMNVLGDAEPDHFVGYVTFRLEGQDCRLEALGSRAGLFFNFKDASSGKTTYPAGRFLYTAKPENGLVTLDFNEAVNPPCAFTEFATCPLPPKDNVLGLAVLAGEKKTH